MQFVDAHCHLQFERIASLTSTILKESISKGITHFVVNATSPEDFNQVIQIQNQYQHITPCFGIHPYYIKESQKEEDLERLYSQCKEINCNYCIGEIGMDKTITSTISLQLQETMFRKQIQFAISQSVPFIVHCVRCIGSVYQVLQNEVKQPYPFLMHGYSGSADFVPKLVKLGAYFSISNYFLNLSPNRRKAMEDTIKQIPLDRLLFESDAPDMVFPLFLCNH